MTPLQWSIILLLSSITFIGFPTAVVSDAPSKEIKPSTASECRVHIEKALEQYWDHPEPVEETELHTDQNTNKKEQNINYESSFASKFREQNDNDRDDDDENIPEDDDSENEDHSESNNREIKNKSTKENDNSAKIANKDNNGGSHKVNSDIDNSNEDENESDEDEQDDDETEEHESDEAEEQDDDEAEEQDDDEAEEQGDDEVEEQDDEPDEQNDEAEEQDDDAVEEQNGDETEEQDDDEADGQDDEAEKLGDEETEEQDDDEQDGEEVEELEDDEAEQQDDDETKEQNDDGDSQQDDEDDNEDLEKTEETIKNNYEETRDEERDEPSDTIEIKSKTDYHDEDSGSLGNSKVEAHADDKENEDNMDDEDSDDNETDDEDGIYDDDEKRKDKETVDYQNEISAGEIKIEIQIESDKVTGEADRASSRMASEFLDEKSSTEQPKTTKDEEKILNASTLNDNKESEGFDAEEETGTEGNDEPDDTIENIYEEEEEPTSGITYRSRDHIDVILGLDEIGTEYDNEEEKLAQNIFRDVKKIYTSQIRPIEMLYKYADSTTRVLGDAEIFSKPMLLFLGPWSAGKSTIINYLLGIERTPNALKSGTGITDTDFTILTYGEQTRIRSGTELAADWRYAGIQRFGQGFLDHFRGLEIPHTLLKKITIVDSPGILENKKNTERGYSLNDAFQWFIDRSDAIYVVLDPSKVDVGAELGSVLDQLKGRDARFLLNKADSIRRSDLMRVVGQLFWNLSPLMSSTEAPLIYAVSLTTKPYHPSAPAKFLTDQEKNCLYDMKEILEKRIENRILYARRHAVRVRNHAKMIDCYLATYYRHKSIFSNKRNVAKLIIENPHSYNLFDGFGGMTNVSRFDLPDPTAYKEFFKLHPMYDFKPLASTCSYFRGCPMDKLDLAISKDIPELLAKYKKMKLTNNLKHNR